MLNWGDPSGCDVKQSVSHFDSGREKYSMMPAVTTCEPVVMLSIHLPLHTVHRLQYCGTWMHEQWSVRAPVCRQPVCLRQGWLSQRHGFAFWRQYIICIHVMPLVTRISIHCKPFDILVTDTSVVSYSREYHSLVQLLCDRLCFVGFIADNTGRTAFSNCL